jgi:hypothetical protein
VACVPTGRFVRLGLCPHRPRIRKTTNNTKNNHVFFIEWADIEGKCSISEKTALNCIFRIISDKVNLFLNSYLIITTKKSQAVFNIER